MKLRFKRRAGAATRRAARHAGPASPTWRRREEVDRQRVPAFDALQGRADEEMKWFIEAAEALPRGMEIKVVSETITTHEYESKTLAKAFEEITGIKVKHDLIQEGDVIEKLQTQMQSGENIYDAYINDTDLIGTHYRYGMVPLTDFMAGEGKDVTLPDARPRRLHRQVVHHRARRQALPAARPAVRQPLLVPLRLVPAQPDLKDKFKEKYGYDLGVPVNWSAYEDIAEFFTNDVKEIDGKPVYGHMDYGKKDPSLGWRFTDAWLSMAGTGDKGIPNGKPVDEWGIRVEGCRRSGASVSRGGETNGPAAVYALTSTSTG